MDKYFVGGREGRHSAKISKQSSEYYARSFIVH